MSPSSGVFKAWEVKRKIDLFHFLFLEMAGEFPGIIKVGGNLIQMSRDLSQWF
jgi:hypothetical protein